MLGFVALFVVASAAFSLSAVSGGGAGLIVMPLLGLLLPADHVPAALSIGTAVSSASRMALFFKVIRWQVVFLYVPMALPAAWAGILLLKQFRPAYLDLLLGLFLLSNLPLMLRPRKKSGISSKTSNSVWLPLIGALAGFISGFTGAVGLIFNGFYYRLGLRKEEIVATRAANDILLHIFKVVLYALYGLIDQATIKTGVVVAIAALASSWGMRLYLHHIPDYLFRQIGRGAAVVAGVAMVALAGRQILVQDRIVLYFNHTEKAVELAANWRQHKLSVEVENLTEVELRHSVLCRGVTCIENPKIQDMDTILHISLDRGIYIAKRIPSLGSGLITRT